MKTPSAKAAGPTLQAPPSTKSAKLLQHFKSYFWLYLFLVPTLVWFAIFCYGPMSGVVIAFKKYKISHNSFWEAPWADFFWFERFFKSVYAERTIRNTLVLSLYSLLTFPLPIIFALMINEVSNAKFKNVIQTIMYAPHFISMVVLVSMMNIFFANSGLINMLIQSLGGEEMDFLTNPDTFPHMYVWSFVWQNLGWNCIIYVAALSSVDPALHEAATLDGANRIQRIWHINLPTILPTVVITLIMRVGSIMTSNTDKALLMKNNLNADTAEVIGTFVYDIGLGEQSYSYATAVGLFSNVINLVLLLIVNKISQKVTETSLF